MARSKNKNKKTIYSSMPSAKPLAFARPLSLPRLNRLPSVTLNTFEDRRTFHPEPYTRVAFALPRSAAQLVSGPNKNVNRQAAGISKAVRLSEAVPVRIGFKIPTRVALCVRRNRRKEVLFALRRTGKGARSPKRRNYFSQIGC